MKRRDFVKTGAAFAAGAMLLPMAACNDSKDGESSGNEGTTPPVTEFTLPPLPYPENALEPHIDTETMGLHHGKHHAGYVSKLNDALKGHPLAGKDLEAIMAGLSREDVDTALRNNGGGHYNHSLFWKVMRPGGESRPSGKLADAINAAFGNYEDFKAGFSEAAATRFGSGWAWLSVDGSGKLYICSTPNQDNPLMKNIAEQPGTPILGIDVWEHAYYLHYQNRRKDYISSFYNLINWEEVAANFAKLG